MSAGRPEASRSARVELHATAARRAVARAHRGLREQAKHVLSSVAVAPKRRIAAGGLEEPDSKSRPRSPERHALFEIEIENTIAQQPSPEPLPTAILEGERAREHHATRQPETVANNPSDENAPRADWLSSLIGASRQLDHAARYRAFSETRSPASTRVGCRSAQRTGQACWRPWPGYSRRR